MILKSVKLSNIRSYLKENIDFPEGSVLIRGDIGSGKSTILLAVEFALFGIQRGQLSGEALLRNGKAQGSVELAFSMEGKDIIVHRKLKRVREGVVQAAGYIIQDESKYEGTPVELKARILEILGYPKAMLTKSKNLLYRFTVYTPQEDMKQILTEDSEARLDTLRRLFNIDKYKRIKENSQLLIRMLKNEQTVLSAKSEGIAESESHLTRLKETQKDTETRLEAFRPKFEAIRTDLGKTRAKIAELEKSQAKRIELEKRITELSKRQEDKVAEFSNIKRQSEDEQKELDAMAAQHQKLTIALAGTKADTIAGKKKELYNIRQKLAIKKEREKRLLSDIRALEDELSRQPPSQTEQLQKELDEILEKLSSIKESQIESLLVQQRTMIAEESGWKTRIEERVKKERSISELDECPMCMQKVEHTHKERIVRMIDNELSDAQKELSKIQTKKAANEKEIENEKQKDAVRSKLKEEAAELKEKLGIMHKDSLRIKESKSKLETYQKELQELKESLADLPEEESILKRLAEMEQLDKNMQEMNVYSERIEGKKKQIASLAERSANTRSEIGKMNAEKSSVQDSLSTSPDCTKDIALEREQEMKSDESLLNMRGEISAYEQKMKDALESATMLEQEIARKKGNDSKKRELSQKQRYLEELFVNLVDVIEKHVMASIHREFNELFRSWFVMLMEDEAIQARIDDKFMPIVVQNGYETDIANLSGGEKTSLALAYRLALNKVINDLISGIKTKDIIILDEPTDGFSSEQLDNVKDVLEQLGCKQVIIVSHEAKVESFVESVISVRKQEHESSINQAV